MTDQDTQFPGLSPQRHRAAITELVNAERRSHGLKPLLPNRGLIVSARVWALVEGRVGMNLSHGNFARRALRFPFVLAGRPKHRRAVGENLAFGSGEFSTPREIVQSWMDSPGHRANILRNWSYGAVWSSHSEDGVVVVQHFGRTIR